MRRAGRIGFAGLLVLIALGYSTIATQAQRAVPVPNYSNIVAAPVQSAETLKFEEVVRQQYDLSCGAAALATLLRYYYGEDVSERELINLAFRFGDAEQIRRDGFSMLELKRVGEHRGYVVEAFRILDVDALRTVDVPLLTLIKTQGYEHFVVIRSIDENQVRIADPAYGNRTLSVRQFKGEWQEVIMAFLSPTRQGRGEFRTVTGGQPPAAGNEVMSLVDRPFVTIMRDPGQF